MQRTTVTRLDLTSVSDREDIAAAFGPRAAWRANILQLRKRIPLVTDRRRKLLLELELLSAENQLRLLDAPNQGE
jgi:hypothetical protein